jgi:hypothetical protein
VLKGWTHRPIDPSHPNVVELEANLFGSTLGGRGTVALNRLVPGVRLPIGAWRRSGAVATQLRNP